MRKGAVLVIVLLGVLGLTGCSGGSGHVMVQARFTDVGDLASRAPVMMADVPVGIVKGIKLSGDEALVTMSIDRSAHVPAGVTARVRLTSLLGERIVDLVPPSNLPPNAPELANGQTIRNTVVRPDLEDLVQAGNSALQSITASEVGTLVNEGARGFGGQGTTLRSLLDSFQTIVHAYAGKSGEIQSVISSLNQLNTTLASHASAQGRSLVNSARALDMLREEGARLQAAIHALARLSVGARSILDAHSDEMARFFAQMRVILGVLVRDEGDLEGLLRWAPFHNRNTQLVEYLEFNQIVQDFVICGFNNDNSDPARRCNH
jgi:phospholipid/cholesterol/gamma-HCH transport system substrate-binding protein